MLGLRFSPVYPPIFICVFALALFFVTILLFTKKPSKPGDQAQPVGYKRQDDERQEGDQAKCRVVGQRLCHRSVLVGSPGEHLAGTPNLSPFMWLLCKRRIM